ncbi:MAG: AAA family ATPase [Clostridiales bacterium]|nr:AAA family ATPase [Clostridiales bacterium]
MLKALNIENIAVIERTDIEFTPGFNILTGETGAGKSIVIDAIHAVLGERTTRELVRTGTEHGSVSALFSQLPDAVVGTLREMDLSPEEDGTLLIQRRISADGKSVCKVNGRTVTVGMLREIGRQLVNIHGQHDSQTLLDAEQHYRFLDMLAEDRTVFSAYSQAFRNLIETRRELRALLAKEEEAARREELLA